MKIIVKGILADDFLDSLRDKIENKEIETWKFVKDGNFDRLLHIGDAQYNDVVIRIAGPKDEAQKKGVKFTQFEPKVRANIEGAEAIEKAHKHFGVVLGRLAEELNCHYTEIGEYKTVL